jgi:hypothetical protein
MFDVFAGRIAVACMGVSYLGVPPFSRADVRQHGEVL